MLPDHPTKVSLTLAFATTLLGVLCLWSVAATAEPQCVASFREIKFPDGSARVKNYICKTEGSAKPVIRVEFDRLSEAAAGSLIEGEAYPDMETAFGKVRVVNNAVAVEAKKIFDQFGTKSAEASCYGFQISAAAGGNEYANSRLDGCDEAKTVWYLTWPRRMSSPTLEMPLPSDLKRYQTTSKWPGGYSFYYHLDEGDCWKTSPIACTLIWRGARQEDLSNYWANRAAEEEMLDLPSDDGATAESENGANDSGPQEEPDVEHKYISLMNYLAQGGWPDDFLFITGAPDLCAGGLYFSLHVRQLILDVAFIKNLSDQPVSIDGLLGNEAGEAQLRKAVSGVAASPDRIAGTAEPLQPGDTIAVPLDIAFVMSPSLQEQFGNRNAAEAVFKRIQSAKPGTVFQLSEEGWGAPVQKIRESFGSPSMPTPANYDYGPQLRLSGLVIDGKSIIFDQASRNFMQLASTTEEGSCPYLYAWDDGDKAWVRHGKVIDKADSKDKEMTETKTFPGFRSKFRLAEEELEVSYIDHVKLEVELNDGTGMSLKPDFAAMAEQDARYATIKAGDRIEFSFALPPSIKAEDVKQSTLAVSGYYRRYSDLLMAKQ